MSAIDSEDLQKIRAVLASGISPNDYPPGNADEDDMAPINAAVRTHKPEIVELLLNAGADIEASDPWGGPPLCIAARDGDLRMMQFLLHKGAKINDLGKEGSSALYGAAVDNQVSALQFLLDRGANPRTKMGNDSALAAAGSLGQTESATMLEKAQAARH